MRNQAGFTLLEVLVAMAILAVAITTMLQLSAQSLRLLGLSGDAKSAQTPVAALGDPKHGRGAQVRPGEAVVALGSRGARLA